MAKFYKIAGVTALASLCIGIILIVTGLLFGGKHSLHSFWSNADLTSKSYTEVKSFSSIDVDIDSAKVIIEHGKNYGFEYKLVGDEDDIECEVRDGVLVVKDEYDDKSGFHFIWHWSDDACITIYVPDSVELDSVIVDTDAGNIRINDIVADEFSLDSDAGSITLKNIESTEGISAETNAGNINVEGKLGGDCDFTSDCGNVNVETDFSSKMYSYDTDTSLGHVDVRNSDGDDLSDSDNDGNYKMTVNTDVGNVELIFK